MGTPYQPWLSFIRILNALKQNGPLHLYYSGTLQCMDREGRGIDLQTLRLTDGPLYLPLPKRSGRCLHVPRKNSSQEETSLFL